VEVSDLEHRRPGRHAPPQQRPQPRHQHDERERLAEEVVGTGVERLGLVPLAVLGREHQDRRPDALGAEVAAHLVAVAARQHDVEHDGGVGVGAGPLEPLEPVVDGLDLEALGGEPARDGVGQGHLVLHQQHAHAVSLVRPAPVHPPPLRCLSGGGRSREGG
jgi:hypothetical protein